MKKLVILMMLLVAASAGAWDFGEFSDMMTDTVSPYAYLTAIDSQGTFQAPALVIRLQEGEFSAFINWNGYSVGRETDKIFLRFGDDAPTFWSASPSTDREAVFIRDADAFLEALQAGRLVALSKTATGRDMVAVWEIGDIDEVISRMK